jgi:hypothetical protein
MITANMWLKEKVYELEETNFEQLSSSEKKQIRGEAQKTGKKEQAKAALIGATATAIALVAIPLLLLLGVVVNSTLLILSPDGAFYPLVAAMAGASAFFGWKGIEALSQFYRESVIDRWNYGAQIQNLTQNL